MPDRLSTNPPETVPAGPSPREPSQLALPTDEETRKAVVAAYAHLARRSFSRKALGERLRRTIESAEAVERALDWLEQRRLLDDRRLAEEAVRVGSERKGWGRRKLQQWLKGRGIDDDTARQAMATIDPDVEASKAAELAERQRERGKRPEQIFRFLVARGFSADVARTAALPD